MRQDQPGTRTQCPVALGRIQGWMEGGDLSHGSTSKKGWGYG